MHDPVDDVPPYSSFFQQMYDRHIAEIEAQERTLRIALTEADQQAGLRARSINGKTTSPTVKIRVLKQRIIKKLDELAKLSKQMAPIVIGLRLDEIELAILMHGQRRMAVEDWRRIADGKVYEGAKFFFDMLYKNHHIDSYAPGFFQSSRGQRDRGGAEEDHFAPPKSLGTNKRRSLGILRRCGSRHQPSSIRPAYRRALDGQRSVTDVDASLGR